MTGIAFRAPLLDFVAEPADGDDQTGPACRYIEDGLLLVRDGRIAARGPASELLPLDDESIEVRHYQDALLVPGFIDTHIHFPQLEVIASYGTQLLEWLERYTFPTERRYADAAYARERAAVFCDELLRNGTTTALVFASVHPQSAEALFEEALARNMRLIAGKVLMDRNAPEYLRDSPQSGYEQSAQLIEQWHGRGRLGYAVTPRFAPTSSDEQLQFAGRLLREYPDVHLHTHLAENHDEIKWVAELFPAARDYTDVYDSFGLVRDRSVFAHGIHLSERECQCLGGAGAAISFCPTSNLFLGSGLFDYATARGHGIGVGLGTDVGGGTSFSMLRTLDEAYKVLQLRQQQLDPFRAFYLATRGGAAALDLDDRVGSLSPGMEADFVVLDLAATPLMAQRLAHAENLQDRLFMLQVLGDDRSVRETWVAGKCAHARGQSAGD